MGGCGNADTSPPSSTPSGPAIQIEGSALSHHDDKGRLVWTMDAATVQYDRGAKESRAQDVRVRFMDSRTTDDDRTISLTVRANHLVFEHQTRNLFLQGGVRGDGPDGLTFETDRAQWDAEQRLVTGNAVVRIQREDLSMHGTGFSYDLDRENLTLQSASLQVQLETTR